MKNILIKTKHQLQKSGWVFIKSIGGRIYARLGDMELSARCLETLRKKITERIHIESESQDADIYL